MAGLPWIQVHNDLLAHPKTLRLAIKLADERAWTYLVQLWLWASMHAPGGRIEGPGCEAVLARAAGWSKEPETFVRALHEARFLDQTPEGYAIHNWDLRAGAHIAKREKERERVRTWREQNENRTRTERVPNKDVRGERERETEKETKKLARSQRARRAKGEPKSAPEAALPAVPPTADAASGATPRAASLDRERGVGQAAQPKAADSRDPEGAPQEPASATHPAPDSAEAVVAWAESLPGEPGDTPQARIARIPPPADYVPPGFRKRAPDLDDDLPRHELVVEDHAESPLTPEHQARIAELGRRIQSARSRVEEWPLTGQVLEALWACGWDAAEWPKSRASAHEVEEAIRVATVPVAVERLLAYAAAERAKGGVPRPYLGWHTDTILARAKKSGPIDIRVGHSAPAPASAFQEGEHELRT